MDQIDIELSLGFIVGLHGENFDIECHLPRSAGCSPAQCGACNLIDNHPCVGDHDGASRFIQRRRGRSCMLVIDAFIASQVEAVASTAASLVPVETAGGLAVGTACSASCGRASLDTRVPQLTAPGLAATWNDRVTNREMSMIPALWLTPDRAAQSTSGEVSEIAQIMGIA